MGRPGLDDLLREIISPQKSYQIVREHLSIISDNFTPDWPSISSNDSAALSRVPPSPHRRRPTTPTPSNLPPVRLTPAPSPAVSGSCAAMCVDTHHLTVRATQSGRAKTSDVSILRFSSLCGVTVVCGYPRGQWERPDIGSFVTSCGQPRGNLLQCIWREQLCAQMAAQRLRSNVRIRFLRLSAHVDT